MKYSVNQENNHDASENVLIPQKNNVILNAFKNAASVLIVTLGPGTFMHDKNDAKLDLSHRWYGPFSLLGTSALVAYGTYHDIKENMEIDKFSRRIKQERAAQTAAPSGQSR
jgi:hypothetical protein